MPRRAELSDRDAVHDILITCGGFSELEVHAGMEVFDDNFDKFVSDVDGVPRSYIAVAPIQLTESTWHIYWIATHGAYQRRGLAAEIQRHAEEFIRNSGGKRVTLETSGRPDYGPTRRFYESQGFRVAGQIPDFYKPGDDCVIYWKAL